jgi:starvation-inducible outer membrane lipoprotein
MKILALLALTMMLSACQTPPRFISQAFNAQDPCQYAGKREGYQLPNWCGASAGKVVNVQQGLSRNNYIVTVK